MYKETKGCYLPSWYMNSYIKSQSLLFTHINGMVIVNMYLFVGVLIVQGPYH